MPIKAEAGILQNKLTHNLTSCRLSYTAPHTHGEFVPTCPEVTYTVTRRTRCVPNRAEPASHHGPLVYLWYDLLSWSSSAIRIGIASGGPRQPLVLNINDPSTFTAYYEASTVPLSDFSRLSELSGDSELSWATAPSVCILNRAPKTMMTPSQFWRRYSPGKVVEYPGHNVAISAPMNFNVEPAEIMSTQSPVNLPSHPWLRPIPMNINPKLLW